MPLPYIPYKLASATLNAPASFSGAASLDQEPIAVPTPQHPGLDDDADDHGVPYHQATDASVFFPANDGAYVFARVLEGGRELQLRWSSLHSHAEATSSQAISKASSARSFTAALDPRLETEPARSFLFPAPLLPSLGIFVDAASGTLYIVAVTTSGFLYRLTFSVPLLFHDSKLSAGWASEYRIQHLATSDSSISVAQAYIADAGLVLITCADGTIVKLSQSRSGRKGAYEGTWKEQILRPTSFLSGVSRFFGRSNASSDIESSPIYALALDTFQGDAGTALAFAASRDRKLRVWNLVSDSCVRTIDLPLQMDSTGSTERQLIVAQDETSSDNTGGAETQAYFSTVSRPLVKVFAPGQDEPQAYALYVLVYIPASLPSGNFFALYGVELEETKSSSGGLGDVALLWQKRCDVETRVRNVELRDVAFTPQGDDLVDGWVMWTLWDSGSGPLLKYAKVGVDSANADESVVSIKMASQDLSQDDWRTVNSERVYQPLHGPDFEATLEATKELVDPAEIFVERVLEPGRFSQATLRLALSTYRDEDVSDSRPFSSQFASLRDEVASAVASNCKLETDPRTGGALYEKLYSSKIREWMRFVGLAEQIETSARWPIRLALAQAPNPDFAGAVARVPLVVTREGLGLPIVEDEASIVERLQRKATELLGPVRGGSAAVSELINHERDLLIQTADTHTHQDVLPLLGGTSATVAEVFTLLESASDLASRFTAPELEAFSAGLQGLLAKPLTISIKEALADVWDTHLAAIAGDEAAAITAKVVSDIGTSLDSTITDMIILLSETAGLFGEARYESAIASTDAGSAWTADALVHTISSRHRLAVTFTLLLSALAAHDVMSELVSNEMALIAASLSVFQSLSAALQLARADGVVQVAPNTGDAAETDSIVARLNQMSVAGRKSREPHHFAAPTLLHQCIRDQLLAVSDDVDSVLHEGSRATPSMQVKSGVLWSLWSLGMTDARGCLKPDSAPLLPQLNGRHTALAFAVLIEGYPLSAEALLSNFPESSASEYVRARALVQMQRLDEATVSFEKVVSALELASSLRGGQQPEDGLFDLLPSTVTKAEGEQRVAAYYRHVSTFFEPLEAAEYIIKFLQASIDAVGTFADAAHGEDSASAGPKEVRYKIFRCQLGLDDFEGAYGTIMATPYEGVRRDCLRNLVGDMCEEGHIQPLLTFTFPGLQQEVERTLSFKARNSDPLSSPNYYSVLYSYHVFRGDLKSAGAVMYQHAERLSGVLRSGPAAYQGLDALDHFMVVAVEQAQSYLASINALTMLKHEHAWFAHAATDPSDASTSDSIFGAESDAKESSTTTTRRIGSGGSALTRYMPVSAYSRKVKDIRVVSVDDVRREYTLALARLELARRYPDLAYSTTVLRPTDAVLLFVNSDQFDSAFSTAYTLGVDMAPIFSALTLKAVALSRAKAERDAAKFGGALADVHPEIEALENEDEDALDPETLFLTLSEKSAGWGGSAATRAWKYVQHHLEMFDRDGTYYQVVLAKAASSGHAFTPSWLTKWFTATDNQDVLLRVWIKHNLVLEAAQSAIEWLQTSTAQAASLTRSNSQCIAYHLIDTILLNLQPDSTCIVPSKRDEAKTTKARLEDAVKKHIAALAARSKTLKRQAEQDSYRQEKRREASGHASANGMRAL